MVNKGEEIEPTILLNPKDLMYRIKNVRGDYVMSLLSTVMMKKKKKF